MLVLRAMQAANGTGLLRSKDRDASWWHRTLSIARLDGRVTTVHSGIAAGDAAIVMLAKTFYDWHMTICGNLLM